MERKLLTVVVPTYNMEKYLDRCLSSLIVDESRMSLLEVLVVNDGSKDRSSEIAHGYESRYPDTFRVIDKENGNYGSCINAALPVAKGKYIKVLDADDFVEMAGLCSLLTFLSETDDDAVITNTIDVDGDGKERGRKKILLEEGRVYQPNDIDEIVLNSLFMHELTYRTDILREIGYRQTEGISYTDLEWAYYPMAAVGKIRYCSADVYCYRQGRAGQTVEMAQRCRSMWMEEKIIKQMFERLESNVSIALPGSRSFLKLRLSLYSSRIYFYYLLEYKDVLDERLLKEFDDFIKDRSRWIYEHIDNMECQTYLGRFKYIHDWRKRQSRRTLLFFLYDMYRYISNVRHNIIGR